MVVIRHGGLFLFHTYHLYFYLHDICVSVCAHDMCMCMCMHHGYGYAYVCVCAMCIYIHTGVSMMCPKCTLLRGGGGRYDGF